MTGESMKTLRTSTAWLIVSFTTVATIFISFALLFCLQVNQLAEMHKTIDKQDTEIAELEMHLGQLQNSHLGHVSQQVEFQTQMKRAAGKAGYWWAYVQLNKTIPRTYSDGRVEVGQ